MDLVLPSVRRQSMASISVAVAQDSGKESNGKKEGIKVVSEPQS